MCRQMAFDVVLTDDSSNASPLGIPFIVLAGAGDNQIQRAVTAFRDGAMDFLQILRHQPSLRHAAALLGRGGSDTTPLPKQRMSAHAMGRAGARAPRPCSPSSARRTPSATCGRSSNGSQPSIPVPSSPARTGPARSWSPAGSTPRADGLPGPFVEVNCAAIPSELIESELFGHERGAFTSAIKQRKGKVRTGHGRYALHGRDRRHVARGPGQSTARLQENKICRVGSGKDIDVDVRVIAATNKNLREEIAKGNFREDLYHRLSVIVIRVPPLRERSSDVPELTQHFVDEIRPSTASRSSRSTPTPWRRSRRCGGAAMSANCAT